MGGGTALLYLSELGLFDIQEERFSAILNWEPNDNTVIFDRHGTEIAELFSSYHIYHPYHQIPEGLIHSIVAVEDRKFWTHNGVDPQAMLRALFAYLTQSKKGFRQGASTITQQLVRHFLLPREKTINRKVKEIILAIHLERYLDKKKIIEIYANSLFLGHGAYGVGSAAMRYFNKPLKDLHQHELSLIAGLFQSPSRFNPHRSPKKAKRRQKKVLLSMLKSNYLTVRQYKYWLKKPLQYKTYNPSYGTKAPYFVDFIRNEALSILDSHSIKNQGLRIHTSLDSSLQTYAEQAIKENKPLLEKIENEMPTYETKQGEKKHHALEAAIVVTNPKNGDVLALVGGRNYKKSKFNRVFQAKRQPGSVFKPVIYSLALENEYKWNDIIFVAPITLEGHYRPRSYEGDYMTRTTLLRAFYKSMNAPTLEIGQKLGIKPIISHAEKLGITSPIKMEFGSILGSSELSMMELASMNGVFANAGVLVKIRGITAIQDRKGSYLYQSPSIEERSSEALSPRNAFLTLQGLRQVLKRGTGWRYNKLWEVAAGKTGTSNKSKDNWFSGFTPNLVAVTWVGNDDSLPLLANSQGGTIALPIWADFIEKSFQSIPATEFPIPEGVTAVKINPRNGQPSSEGIDMWFLEENAPQKGQEQNHSKISNTNSFRNPFTR